MSGSLLVGDLPPVGDDEDLESLLTDMELSVPRTTVRRNGGVESLGEENPNLRAALNFETPGPWPGSREGTSGSVSETMYGQTETVISDPKSTRIPKSVSLRPSVGSTTAKRFKLFRVPQEGEGCENMCLDR